MSLLTVKKTMKTLTVKAIKTLYDQLSLEKQEEFKNEIIPTKHSVAVIQGDTYYGATTKIFQSISMDKIITSVADYIEFRFYLRRKMGGLAEDKKWIREKLKEDIHFFDDHAPLGEMYQIVSVTTVENWANHFEFITGGRDGMTIEVVDLGEVE